MANMYAKAGFAWWDGTKNAAVPPGAMHDSASAVVLATPASLWSSTPIPSTVTSLNAPCVKQSFFARYQSDPSGSWWQ